MRPPKPAPLLEWAESKKIASSPSPALPAALGFYPQPIDRRYELRPDLYTGHYLSQCAGGRWGLEVREARFEGRLRPVFKGPWWSLPHPKRSTWGGLLIEAIEGWPARLDALPPKTRRWQRLACGALIRQVLQNSYSARAVLEASPSPAVRGFLEDVGAGCVVVAGEEEGEAEGQILESLRRDGPDPRAPGLESVLAAYGVPARQWHNDGLCLAGEIEIEVRLGVEEVVHLHRDGRTWSGVAAVREILRSGRLRRAR